MKDDPIRLLMEGKPTPAILTALVFAKDEEIARAANLLSEADVSDLLCAGMDRLKASGINSTLFIGGLLQLHYTIAKGRGLPDLFSDLIEDLGIAPSSAHRMMQIFRGFGVYLIKEPKLLVAFSGVAPLDVLSAKQTPQSAREEAIELARNGELINTQFALSLKAKHSEAIVLQQPKSSEVSVSSCPEVTKSPWQYVGEFIRAKQIRKSSKDVSLLQGIASELEAALREVNALLSPRLSLNHQIEN